MGKIVNLKLPGIIDLSREEMKHYDGGAGPFVTLIVVTAIVEYELAKEFIAGFGEGWTKNKL